MRSGIYKISSPSGGFYIGSAVDFDRRRRQHFCLLRRGYHHNRPLQAAANKYGIDCLIFEPLIVCGIDDLIFFEQRAIDILKPRYNRSPTAGNQLGLRHSLETIKKISTNRKGKGLHPKEWKSAKSLFMQGRKHMLGHVLTEEQKKRQSDSLLGKKHVDGFESVATDEQKRLIGHEYRSGFGVQRLAKKYRTSHRAIKRILDVLGIPAHPSGGRFKQNGS